MILSLILIMLQNFVLKIADKTSRYHFLFFSKDHRIVEFKSGKIKTSHHQLSLILRQHVITNGKNWDRLRCTGV